MGKIRKLFTNTNWVVFVCMFLFVFTAACLISLPTLPDLAPSPTETKPSSSEEVDYSRRYYEDVTPATEVVFWHQYQGIRQIEIERIADEFNKSNDWRILVTPVYMGGYAEIQESLLPLLNTGKTPDVVTAYQSQIAEYQLSDSVIDLTPLMESTSWGFSQEEKLDFPTGIYNQDVFPTFNDQHLGFPYYRAMEVMYYNQDWLEELGYDTPPKTPEQFKEMACAAANQPFSGAESVDSMGYLFTLDASRLASWSFAFGGDIFSNTFRHFTYDEIEVVSAMEFMQDLFNDGCAEIATESYGDQNAFSEGTVLFTIASTSGLPYYESSVSSGADFDWSVAAIPHTGLSPVMNVYGASLMIPRSTPEREVAAWIFIHYLTSPQVQASWCEVSDYLPVRESAEEYMSEYLALHEPYLDAYQLLSYSKGEPAVPAYETVRDFAVEALVDILMENANVLQVLRQLNVDAQSILTETMNK